jgi:ABC-type uncharacterized transport system permease subunit
MEAWHWAAVAGFTLGYFAAAYYAIQVKQVSQWLVIPCAMLGGASLGTATGCAARALLS